MENQLLIYQNLLDYASSIYLETNRQDIKEMWACHIVEFKQLINLGCTIVKLGTIFNNDNRILTVQWRNKTIFKGNCCQVAKFFRNGDCQEIVKEILLNE